MTVNTEVKCSQEEAQPAHAVAAFHYSRCGNTPGPVVNAPDMVNWTTFGGSWVGIPTPTWQTCYRSLRKVCKHADVCGTKLQQQQQQQQRPFNGL